MPHNSTIPRICEHCGKPFDAPRPNVLKGFGRFCSRRCGRLHQPPRPVADRFWEKVSKTDTCWLWIGKHTPRGYGHFIIGGKVHRAHRLSWQMHNGPIPDGVDVLHECDTPACVNPAHLFLGTHDDNMADMREKQRASWGERSSQSKLTEEQVREIRQRYATGTLTYRALGADYGVTASAVRGIVSGRSWRHLD